MGGTRLQPGDNAALRFQHRRLKFGGAGKRGKHHLAVARRGERAVGPYCALRAQRRRSLWATVVNRKQMAGTDQATRDRGSHRSGSDKADPHGVIVLRWVVIIDRSVVNGNRFGRTTRERHRHPVATAMSDSQHRLSPIRSRSRHAPAWHGFAPVVGTLPLQMAGPAT